MNVGELVDILNQVDRDRLVYVPDHEGKAQIVAAVVDMRRENIPIPGISIADDVAIIPASLMDILHDEHDDDEEDD